MRRMAKTDERVAAVAAEKFHEHGITATGVDALSRAAGISKRTLYQRFGSRTASSSPRTTAWTCRSSTDAHRGLPQLPGDPRLQLDALFERLVAWSACRSSGVARSRMPPPSSRPRHPAHAVVRRHKARLGAGCSRAPRRRRRQPEQLASRLMLLFAGVQAQSLVDRSDRPAREAKALAAELIAAATR